MIDPISRHLALSHVTPVSPALQSAENTSKNLLSTFTAKIPTDPQTSSLNRVISRPETLSPTMAKTVQIAEKGWRVKPGSLITEKV